MKPILVFAVAILGILATIATNGYTLMTLFNWFFVPILGSQAISFALACGVSLTVKWINYREPVEEISEDTFDAVMKYIRTTFAFPAVTLLIGYAIHSFM